MNCISVVSAQADSQPKARLPRFQSVIKKPAIARRARLLPEAASSCWSGSPRLRCRIKPAAAGARESRRKSARTNLPADSTADVRLVWMRPILPTNSRRRAITSRRFSRIGARRVVAFLPRQIFHAAAFLRRSSPGCATPRFVSRRFSRRAKRRAPLNYRRKFAAPNPESARF